MRPSGVWAMVLPAQHIARTFFGWISIQRDRTPQKKIGGTGASPVRRARPTFIHKTTDVSASLFLDAEIIGHRENIGNAFGLHLGNLLVHLTSDHTFQRDVTIIDDDVDRRDR